MSVFVLKLVGSLWWMMAVVMMPIIMPVLTTRAMMVPSPTVTNLVLMVMARITVLSVVMLEMMVMMLGWRWW